MPNNNVSLAEFYNYQPAQLYEGKRWYIGFWIKNPATGKLERKQISFNRIKSIPERRREGRQLCQRINVKLANGWNPLIEQDAPLSFTRISEAVGRFISQNQKALKDAAIRPDTMRSYQSYCTNLLQYWAKYKPTEPYTLQFNRQNVADFLDHIYYERDNSPRTHNNYLMFIMLLGKWMVQNQYLAANPADALKKKREGTKQRTVIPAPVLTQIFSHFLQQNSGYHCLCQLVYNCFIRRTEATQLRVYNVNLTAQTLTIPASVSKNRKEQQVTIPKTLIYIFAEHLKSANQTDYLFSEDFTPGTKPVTPKKISDVWATMKNKLKLPAQYQFYSLKDSGITQLLQEGIPAIVVRDQARHHDISMTDKYTPNQTNLTNQHLKNR